MRRHSDAGFMLVGLIVAVAVFNILLAVVMTSWLSIDRRAREAELLWRGQQIARALECHQRDAGGRLPERLDELVESGCLRRVYEDPMVPDGRWRILTEQDLLDGTVERLVAGPDAEIETDDAATGISSLGGLFGRATAGTDREDAAQGLGALGLVMGGRLGSGQSGETSSRTGIIGVSSTSSGEATRRFRDRPLYSQWVFLPQGSS